MLIVRSVAFNILFYANLIACMVIGMPALLLGPDAVRALARVWGRLSLVLMRVVAGTRVEFRGLDHIPKGAMLVAAKHQSFWEVFALITLFPDFSYVLKRELMRIPLFGWYLARARQIDIDRAKGRAALTQVSQKARAIFAEGRQLLIFPEGTRRPAGAPPQYKYGAAHVYAENNVPCVPVALNSGLFWPRRSFIRRPGTIVVEILPPIAPGMPAMDFLRELESRIEAACERINREAVARDPSLEAALQAGAAMATAA